MGLRGIGSQRRKAAADSVELPADYPQPWLEPGLSRADRVCTFIESLPCTKGFGAGAPIKLLAFQREWIEAVYAEDADGLRHVRTALLSAARGNGKTVLIAGLCLAHLVGPEAESRGEVYSAAATRDQAAIIFAELEAWITRVPWLRARLNIKRFGKIIEDLETGSVYKALASDAPAAHGLAASFVAADELSQWKRRELYDVLITCMGKRAQPLICIISTQSPNPSNVLSELIDYGERVHAGEIEDPTFHSRLYTVPETADPWNEELWPLANPGIGVIRSLEEMRQEAKRAQRMPTFEASFRNLYLNQRVDAEPKAILPIEWEACGGKVDPEALRGRPCWAGLDMSATRDMSAAVLYFRDDDGAVLAHFWLPKDGVTEKQELDHAPYRTWADAGHITLTPGAAINKKFIVAHLAKLAATYDVQGIAFDRWGIPELQRIMAEDGIKLPLVEHGQGYKDLGQSTNSFEAAMLDGRLNHGGHPVLRWQSANLVYEVDPAGARKPAKNRAVDRIDGMVALIMAIGLAVRAEPKRKSVYATRGLLALNV
jgi:phage terminase large subunit-like protein